MRSGLHVAGSPILRTLSLVLRSLSLALAVLAAGCATAPTAIPVVTEVTWEEKIDWIVRLENLRLLRDPNPPGAPVLVPATGRAQAVLGPTPPSDLVLLLSDAEARVRRRAALAVGRVGIAEGASPLMRLLADGNPEVRQMAAFSLGLIGDPSARGALLAALDDSSPVVQGRAAEALGRIGDRADAAAIGGVVRRHVQAGALNGLDPDADVVGLQGTADAVRLGIEALAMLGSADDMFAAVLDAAGQPVSAWWPVAYGLQRVPDPRGSAALLSLLDTPGRYTAAFAARGLGAMRATGSVPALVRIVESRNAAPAVVVQAVRALAAIADPTAVTALTRVAVDTALPASMRADAVVGLAAAPGTESTDVLLDLLGDRAADVRGAAMRALAAADPDTFLLALSGLDPDRDWTVRVAQAQALAALGDQRGSVRLLTMLRDDDVRVLPGVLGALAGARTQGTADVLRQHLVHADPLVRVAAARGLATLGDRAALPLLDELYRAAASEDTYVVRAAALASAAELDAASARPLLETALADPDWAVRVRAADLLRESGVAAEPLRPAPGGVTVTGAERATLLSPPFSPRAYIDTSRGTVELELAILDAPLTVASFMRLARDGFFDGQLIHRVVPDFVAQMGDPRGDSEGGPGFTIRDELNERPYARGAVGMALDWEDTGGSQFFITLSPQPHLNGRYTAFGSVVAGMEVVDRLERWDRIERIRIRDGVSLAD